MSAFMKRLFVIALVLTACSTKKKEEAKEPPEPVNVGSGSGSAAAGSGSATTADADKEKLVARGEYLANVAGCPICHMAMGPHGPDPSRPMAGGFTMPETFGTWKSPNITQDEKTGIGKWTDEQIAAAIRTGVRADGTQLFPIMPYLRYNRLTDDDTKALVAFLRTVKPVENVVERNTDLKLPKIPAPKPENLPDPTDDPQKHGEYLVTIMDCGTCHTPMTPKGPDMSKQFAGGFEMELPMVGTGKLYTANITSDPETGIGKWSKEDVIKAVKFLTRPDGTVIQGPMQFLLAGWSKMTDADMDAVATFVKSIPAIKNKVPKSTFKPNPPPPGAGAPAAGSGSGSAKP